ncbi:ABC-type nitrate/sulfonate/bicarbonate transport systems, periplasmic components [Pseudomonas sp. URIL14HWK12:I8]|uniref:Substrate-binding protein n=2 Tax=Pseudomonas TaxID=286 RepID=A0AAE6V213_9PSED|nr:ABC transporter substrate-binding protein [Pseudomonas putida]QHB27696.1 substrate-binding protein [Pseudomonas monteilii]SMC90513.1 ABC-type nitrate/sulfonate/bicarbonate transport systems, periplasmic components [Pseudomonas sp. URIL14HWK12:I5]SNB75934.1 ABC-type nitrate/sulfonate/bicarbonate transport systems, periplasmic components [Pseudomonas sp. URIL14HWK12:I8]
MTNHRLRVMWFLRPAIAVAAAWQNCAGLSLEASQNHSSDEQFAALSDGSVDAVVTAMDNVFHWNHRPGPKDFVIVAQVEATTPLSIVASPCIKSVSDLVGAKILVDAPENGFVIALRAMLHQAGLNFHDYTLAPVGGVKERYVSLVKGEGDATLLGPPFDALAVKEGMHKVAVVQESYPEFPGQGLVVRRSSLSSTPGIQLWLKCLSEALAQFPDNQEKLRKSLASEGIPEKAVSAMVQSIPASLIPDEHGVNLLIEHRRRLGLIGSDVTYDQVVYLA